jgi:hypothetical protein
MMLCFLLPNMDVRLASDCANPLPATMRAGGSQFSIPAHRIG